MVLMVLMGAGPEGPDSLEEAPLQSCSHPQTLRQVKGQIRLYKRSSELI